MLLDVRVRPQGIYDAHQRQVYRLDISNGLLFKEPRERLGGSFPGFQRTRSLRQKPTARPDDKRPEGNHHDADDQHP